MADQPDFRARAKVLMIKRENIEKQINSLTEKLNLPGMPGITGNLVDKDGFPRNDIDIPAVRRDRHRLICLHNDHKEMTLKIENIIYELHADPSKSLLERPVSEAKSSESMLKPNARLEKFTAEMPFLLVDDVQRGSPSEEDGLQVGDEILSFGDVKAGDNSVQEISEKLRNSEGKTFLVVFRRQGQILSLSIEPRKWAGIGLLGCRFTPM